MARPIPRNLLVHSVIYEEYTGAGTFGDEFAAPVTLEFVKVDEKSKFVSTENGYEIVKTNLIFIDYVNTIPANLPALVERSKITFRGKTRRVESVDVFTPDNSLPHHQEVITI